MQEKTSCVRTISSEHYKRKPHGCAPLILSRFYKCIIRGGSAHAENQTLLKINFLYLNYEEIAWTWTKRRLFILSSFSYISSSRVVVSAGFVQTLFIYLSYLLLNWLGISALRDRRCNNTHAGMCHAMAWVTVYYFLSVTYVL